MIIQSVATMSDGEEIVDQFEVDISNENGLTYYRINVFGAIFNACDVFTLINIVEDVISITYESATTVVEVITS